MKAAVTRGAILFSKSMGDLVGCLMVFEDIRVVRIAAAFANKNARFWSDSSICTIGTIHELPVHTNVMMQEGRRITRRPVCIRDALFEKMTPDR